eukprot:TRINITY_DN648_c0_g3_i1.p1 TRINITY_DN648_c0_g3~~TRINITY_DN648_c0_g3_i1.p1  ORF type:complete len:304 (-),score=49.17 TRINITY_DN648_c0_g3_i1:57-968(-)
MIHCRQFDALQLEHLAHTVEVEVDSKKADLSGGILHESYSLARFHFHSPSEHTVDGKSFPLEVHFVHINPETRELAVVGFFYEIGEESKTIDAVLEKLEGLPEGDSSDVTLSPKLPSTSGDYWFYSGSLTTPPCTEDVNWFVSKDILTLSQKQLESLFHWEDLPDDHNNRPTQPLNDREVYDYSHSFTKEAMQSFEANFLKSLVRIIEDENTSRLLINKLNSTKTVVLPILEKFYHYVHCDGGYCELSLKIANVTVEEPDKTCSDIISGIQNNITVPGSWKCALSDQSLFLAYFEGSPICRKY